VTTSWRRRWLAIDLGDRRIGLALSDPMGMIASPAGHLVRRPGKRPPLTALLAKAEELSAEGFVIGLALDGQGEETPRAAEARRLAQELATRTGHPTELVDERFTTSAALRAVKAMAGSTRDRKGDVDALAATVLLQHALRTMELRALGEATNA
jgi:putative Holliday junction resolvase